MYTICAIHMYNTCICWGDKKGGSKRTACLFSKLPVYENMHFCLGQWSAYHDNLDVSPKWYGPTLAHMGIITYSMSASSGHGSSPTPTKKLRHIHTSMHCQTLFSTKADRFCIQRNCPS